METMEKEVKSLLSENLIRGTWQLKYKLVNQLGVDGFSGRMISAYTDPLTGRDRYLYNVNNQPEVGFLIEKTVINFDTRSPKDRLIVDWLVGHPEVGIQNNQTKLKPEYMSNKVSNPRITLVNLDHQNVVDLEEEDYIDKLVGKIVDEGPKHINLEKIRFVLSKLNLEYRDEKLINNPKVELTKLRSKLKKFVRSSYNNAKTVSSIFNNLEEAKFLYQIKEMVRTEVLTVNNGMYMYSGNPLGISIESVIKYFNNNPEFYAELTEKLYEKLK